MGTQQSTERGATTTSSRSSATDFDNLENSSLRSEHQTNPKTPKRSSRVLEFLTKSIGRQSSFSGTTSDARHHKKHQQKQQYGGEIRLRKSVGVLDDGRVEGNQTTAETRFGKQHTTI